MPSAMRQALIDYVQDTRALGPDRVRFITTEAVTEASTPYAVIEVDSETVQYDPTSSALLPVREVEWRLLVHGPEEQFVDDIIEQVTRNTAILNRRVSDTIGIEGSRRMDIAVARTDRDGHRFGWRGAAAFKSQVRFYA